MKWELSPRLRRVTHWAGYPVFYLAALFLALRCTFPFERLRDRAIAEFNARNAKDSGMRLEIDNLSGYWLWGIEAEGVRLLAPMGSAEEVKATAPPTPSASTKAVEGTDKPPESKPTWGKRLAEFARFHVSVSPLRGILGTTKVNFGGKAFGGELSGQYLDKSTLREVSLELDKVNLSQLDLLTENLRVPLGGSITGSIELEAPEHQLAKAEGKVELVIDDFYVGDGKTKIRNALALPKCSAGQLTMSADISEGKLQLTKFEAKGMDAEAQAEGQVRLRDPFKSSQAELVLRYKFTPRYMGKNDITKGLFGDPATGVGGLMELDPKVKQAKLPDGFYAWRVMGGLISLTFVPAPEARGGSAASKRPAARSPRK